MESTSLFFYAGILNVNVFFSASHLVQTRLKQSPVVKQSFCLSLLNPIPISHFYGTLPVRALASPVVGALACYSVVIPFPQLPSPWEDYSWFTNFHGVSFLRSHQQMHKGPQQRAFVIHWNLHQAENWNPEMPISACILAASALLSLAGPSGAFSKSFSTHTVHLPLGNDFSTPTMASHGRLFHALFPMSSGQSNHFYLAPFLWTSSWELTSVSSQCVYCI